MKHEATAAESQPSSDRGNGCLGENLGRTLLFGAVFVLPTPVDAGVVYSGVQNDSVTLPTTQRFASQNAVDGLGQDSILIDVDGDLVNDFAFQIRQGRSIGGARRYGSVRGTGLVGRNAIAAGEGQHPIRVTSSSIDARITDWKDGKGLWYRRNSGAASGFDLDAPFILGVRFERSGDLHYGWVRLLIGDGGSGFPASITAVDWAWSDAAGSGIHISPVPETNPALALLAAGGTALAGWRLGRRSKNPDSDTSSS